MNPDKLPPSQESDGCFTGEGRVHKADMPTEQSCSLGSDTECPEGNGDVEASDKEDSSTESLSLKTVETAGAALTEDEQLLVDSFDQSPVLAASGLSSSCYATSDSDSSTYMFHQTQPSSDYDPCPVSNNQQTIVNGSILRPDSLSLPRSLQYFERQRLANQESESSISEHSRSSSTDALIEAASNTPLHIQGTVTKDGDMVAFVAEGLTEMIQRSSPLTKKELIDTEPAQEATSLDECNNSLWHSSLLFSLVVLSEPYGMAWSGSQTPSGRSVSSISSSTSGWSLTNSSMSGFSYSGMSRSASLLTQSPEDIPAIDPGVVFELEGQARKVADSLEHMMSTLQNNLHKMSSIAVNCLDAYKEGVDYSCDSVDAAIKSMYALMAKCEELTKTVRPIYALQEQLKEIKRLLGLFEALVAKEEK